MGPTGGNPCPVVLSGDDLDAHEMQTLARKFGLDTVFILTPRSTTADICLRYFVPEHEMGVSGHATVAAVTVAILNGWLRSVRLKVETPSGIFTVTCSSTVNNLLITLEQNEPTFGPNVPPTLLAHVLGIAVGEIVTTSSPVQLVSVSRPKLLVPLCDFGVLNKLRPNFEALSNACESLQATGLYPFTRNTDKPNADVEARQFPLRAGFPEDAATGVAAAALGAYLTKYDHHCRTGEHTFRIAQGYAMGAPSLIDVIASCVDGMIAKTAIRGVAQITHREQVTL